MSAKRKNKFLQEQFAVDFSHAQVTADQTTAIWKGPADRACVIDRVLYVNPTGLAADDVNYVIIKVLNGGAIAASHSTKLTGGDGAFAANTLVVLNLSATPSDINGASGANVSLFLDCTGAPTLPAGHIRVEGRLL